jgi:hypothetical protein
MLFVVSLIEQLIHFPIHLPLSTMAFLRKNTQDVLWHPSLFEILVASQTFAVKTTEKVKTDQCHKWQYIGPIEISSFCILNLFLIIAPADA